MSQHVNMRLPNDLHERVQEYRARLEKETGLPVSRSDALRLLVEAGLAAKEPNK